MLTYDWTKNGGQVREPPMSANSITGKGDGPRQDGHGGRLSSFQERTNDAKRKARVPKSSRIGAFSSFCNSL